MSQAIPVFDGHNDVLLRLYTDRAKDPVGEFLAGTSKGHIDLAKARAGNLVGGLFAIFCPSPSGLPGAQMSGATYSVPLPPLLPLDDARTSLIGQVALLQRLVAASDGQVSQCRSVSEVRDAVARGSMAAILHLEGADAIDEDLFMLDFLYAAGLRSLGPVWSRETIFGFGVPFRYPSSPDIGPGLTDAGKRLVRACNSLGVMIDLSHMNEKGFWDVAEISTAPLVATHSNVHAISPHPRNLTDRQLDAIRDSDGIVGLNFATGFLRPDGQMRGDTEVEVMVRHLDAMIEKLGETRVALGSDFDGAMIPPAIGNAAGLPVLIEALRAHGYDDALLRKIGSENWLNLLERVIG